MRTRSDVDHSDIIVTGPIGFSLPDGMEISANGISLAKMAVERCDKNSCVAQADLTRETTDFLKGGKKYDAPIFPEAWQQPGYRSSLGGIFFCL